MPIAALSTLQWYGPAVLVVVDDAVSEDLGGSLKAWGAIRSTDDAVSTETVGMTRGRNISLFDDAQSEDLGGSLKQNSAIRFLEDVGDRPSPEAIAQAVWGALAAGLNAAGTMGEKLNDAGGAADPWDDARALTVAKFLGLK